MSTGRLSTHGYTLGRQHKREHAPAPSLLRLMQSCPRASQGASVRPACRSCVRHTSPRARLQRARPCCRRGRTAGGRCPAGTPALPRSAPPTAPRSLQGCPPARMQPMLPRYCCPSCCDTHLAHTPSDDPMPQTCSCCIRPRHAWDGSAICTDAAKQHGTCPNLICSSWAF